jgi:hypothetical protein
LHAIGYCWACVLFTALGSNQQNNNKRKILTHIGLDNAKGGHNSIFCITKTKKRAKKKWQNLYENNKVGKP